MHGGIVERADDHPLRVEHLGALAAAQPPAGAGDEGSLRGGAEPELLHRLQQGLAGLGVAGVGDVLLQAQPRYISPAPVLVALR